MTSTVQLSLSCGCFRGARRSGCCTCSGRGRSTPWLLACAPTLPCEVKRELGEWGNKGNPAVGCASDSWENQKRHIWDVKMEAGVAHTPGSGSGFRAYQYDISRYSLLIGIIQIAPAISSMADVMCSQTNVFDAGATTSVIPRSSLFSYNSATTAVFGFLNTAPSRQPRRRRPFASHRRRGPHTARNRGSWNTSTAAAAPAAAAAVVAVAACTAAAPECTAAGTRVNQYCSPRHRMPSNSIQEVQMRVAGGKCPVPPVAAAAAAAAAAVAAAAEAAAAAAAAGEPSAHSPCCSGAS